MTGHLQCVELVHHVEKHGLRCPEHVIHGVQAAVQHKLMQVLRTILL